MLKRNGLISTWHDRRIVVGEDLNHEIDKNLDDANVILLLVSPYFLASDYCYEIEMKRALERHERDEVRVIPVILHPCDWHGAPFGKLMATPRDGKPISKYPNPHDAFLEIVNAIKDALKYEQDKTEFFKKQWSSMGTENAGRIDSPRSSNLRIKKTFTEQEKDDFLEKSYEFIAKYFEGSLKELEDRNDQVSTKYRRIDANHFTAIIYKNGKVASQCKIWFGGRNHFSGGIAYSSNLSSNDNTLNESASVEEDGYSLLLKTMGMMSYRCDGDQNRLLSQQGLAELFWGNLISPLQ